MDALTIRQLVTMMRDPAKPADVKNEAADALWAMFGEVPDEMLVEVAEVLAQVRPWRRSAGRARTSWTPVPP